MTKIRAWWLCAFMILLAIYLPLLRAGGIMVDDWGDIVGTLYCQDFTACYQSWFPLFASRPLAPLPLTIVTMWFGTHFHAYGIFNAVIYVIATGLLARTIQKIIGAFGAGVYVVMAMMPIIAMPVITSPINQSTASLAYLFWALSILCIVTQHIRHQLWLLVFAQGFLLLSFLTYEIMLPLVVINAFIPLAMGYHIKKNGAFLIGNLIGIITVLLLVWFWQKIWAPQLFDVVHSRLAFDSRNIGLLYRNWLTVFGEQLPGLITKLPQFIKPLSVVMGVLLGAMMLCLVKIDVDKPNVQVNRVRFIWICVAGLLTCPILFILSNQAAEIGGYNARGLTSTWLGFSLVIAASSAFIRSYKSLLLYLLIGLVLVNTLIFSAERDQFVASWKLQKLILSDVLEKSNTVNMLPGATVLGNVPKLLEKDFNGEPVFTVPWDFGAALTILSGEKITAGAVIDTRRQDYKLINLENGEMVIKGLWRTPIQNFWLYDFDPTKHNGSLYQVKDQRDLQHHLVRLGYLEGSNGHSFLVSGAQLRFSGSWLNQKKYLQEGWGYFENWGVWSTAQSAKLSLPLRGSDVKTIEFVAKAFVVPSHPLQKVEIWVNGRYEKTVDLLTFDKNTISVTVPHADLDQPLLNIEFRMPLAVSPKSLGLGEDDRQLGIGLISAKFW